jgi:hypothetical protein
VAASCKFVAKNQAPNLAEARRRRNDSDSDWLVASPSMRQRTSTGDIVIDAFFPMESISFPFFVGHSDKTDCGLTRALQATAAALPVL